MGSVLGMPDYHRILAPTAGGCSCGELLLAKLGGPAPVLDWLRGTTLLPWPLSRPRRRRSSWPRWRRSWPRPTGRRRGHHAVPLPPDLPGGLPMSLQRLCDGPRG